MIDETTSLPAAIVLGAGHGGLGTLQALAARGVTCWVCADESGPAAYSRHARFVSVPNPQHDEAGLIDRVIELARSIPGKPVLFPAEDRYLLACARHQEALAGHVRHCIAAAEVVELLCNHLAFPSWARQHDIDSPRAQAAVAYDGDLRFPIVAKPFNKEVFGANAGDLPPGVHALDLRFTLLADEAAWHSFRQRNADRLDQFVLQEFINGNSADMYSIGIYVDRAGTIVTRFVGRKIRGYPVQHGDAKAAQNDVVPEAVLAEVEAVVRALGLTGVAEVEYRRDPATGRFHLIEINPRCWGWMVACAGSEADVAWTAYRDICGMPVEPTTLNRDPGSIKYVVLLTDLANVVWRYRRDYPPWVMTPWAWWASLKADRLVICELNGGDWPVLLVSIGVFLRDFAQAAVQAIGARLHRPASRVDQRRAQT